MEVAVLDATGKDFPVVQNLVRFYVYDMSETMGWVCPEDGLYGGCDDLPEYWWTGSTPEELEILGFPKKQLDQLSLPLGCGAVENLSQLAFSPVLSQKLKICIPYNKYFERWPVGDQGHPFIVRVGGELAGFAMIKKLGPHHEANYDVGEFFIVRKFRGKGIGKVVAHRLFDRFPGIWEVRQLLDHKSAQAFWRRVIAAYSGNQYQEAKQYIREYRIEMMVQRFTSPGRV